MAKQNYLKLAVVIVLTMAATSTVYAAASIVGTSIGGSSFSASNKVTVYYASDASSTSSSVFDGSNYGIASGHASGDKIIAAQNGDAKLYFKATGANQATVGASSIATGFSTSGWTSM